MARLSRGKILLRSLELRAEVFAFFIDHQFDLQSWMTDSQWLAGLAYLSDIFTKINDVNLAPLVKCATVFTANDTVSAFKRKWQFLGEFCSVLRPTQLPCPRDILEEIN